MNYYESMSDSQKKFMNILGIYSDDDFPKGFFDIIKSTKDEVAESEKFCIDDYSTCYCYNSKLDMSKLVGTDHDRYANRSWVEAFCDLDRADKNLDLFFKNPGYYSNENEEDIDMGVIEKNDEFYIYSRCGGGNNRLIIMKLLYLAMHANNQKFFSPFVSVRKVPSKNTADNIFYSMFPNGEYKSGGYRVTKVDTSVDDELYNVQEGFRGPIVLENVKGDEILNSIEKLNTPIKSR